MTRVLVVDDEPQILRALKVVLREAGFEALPAAGVEEALDVASVSPPDAAIVDLMLPDGTGIDVCQQLRTWTAAPILVLSAIGDEDMKVAALDAGADDYITKPFGSRELLARLRAALRRSPADLGAPTVCDGDLEVDLVARSARLAGEEIHLTPRERDLLVALARQQGRLLTHRHLLVEAWGPAYADDVGVLRTHMANLRRKIGAEHVRTDPGIGYRFGQS